MARFATNESLGLGTLKKHRDLESPVLSIDSSKKMSAQSGTYTSAQSHQQSVNEDSLGNKHTQPVVPKRSTSNDVKQPPRLQIREMNLQRLETVPDRLMLADNQSLNSCDAYLSSDSSAGAESNKVNSLQDMSNRSNDSISSGVNSKQDKTNVQQMKSLNDLAMFQTAAETRQHNYSVQSGLNRDSEYVFTFGHESSSQEIQFNQLGSPQEESSDSVTVTSGIDPDDVIKTSLATSNQRMYSPPHEIKSAESPTFESPKAPGKNQDDQPIEEFIESEKIESEKPQSISSHKLTTESNSDDSCRYSMGMDTSQEIENILDFPISETQYEQIHKKMKSWDQIKSEKYPYYNSLENCIKVLQKGIPAIKFNYTNHGQSRVTLRLSKDKKSLYCCREEPTILQTLRGDRKVTFSECKGMLYGALSSSFAVRKKQMIKQIEYQRSPELDQFTLTQDKKVPYYGWQDQESVGTQVTPSDHKDVYAWQCVSLIQSASCLDLAIPSNRHLMVFLHVCHKSIFESHSSDFLFSYKMLKLKMKLSHHVWQTRMSLKDVFKVAIAKTIWEQQFMAVARIQQDIKQSVMKATLMSRIQNHSSFDQDEYDQLTAELDPSDFSPDKVKVEQKMKAQFISLRTKFEKVARSQDFSDEQQERSGLKLVTPESFEDYCYIKYKAHQQNMMIDKQEKDLMTKLVLNDKKLPISFDFYCADQQREKKKTKIKKSLKTFINHNFTKVDNHANEFNEFVLGDSSVYNARAGNSVFKKQKNKKKQQLINKLSENMRQLTCMTVRAKNMRMKQTRDELSRAEYQNRAASIPKIEREIKRMRRKTKRFKKQLYVDPSKPIRRDALLKMSNLMSYNLRNEHNNLVTGNDIMLKRIEGKSYEDRVQIKRQATLANTLTLKNMEAMITQQTIAAKNRPKEKKQRRQRSADQMLKHAYSEDKTC